jgi:hypothetical protein
MNADLLIIWILQAMNSWTGVDIMTCMEIITHKFSQSNEVGMETEGCQKIGWSEYAQ